MSENEMTFGEYIESIRRRKRKSIRQVANEMGVSAQFYSMLEKNLRTANVEKLEKLRDVLEMTSEEYQIMSTKAAESLKGKNKQVPQDFADYIVERDYVMAALRTMKEMDADQADWKRMVEEFIARKKEQGGDYSASEFRH